MSPRLSNCNLFPVDRYVKIKITSGARKEELDPAWIKETTYFSFLRSRRPLELHTYRKAPQRSKKGVTPDHTTSGQPPRKLVLE